MFVPFVESSGKIQKTLVFLETVLFSVPKVFFFFLFILA